MPYYDEIFKHITGEFPHPLAALALKTPEVEVGDRLGTEHTTVQPDAEIRVSTGMATRAVVKLLLN